MLLVHRAHMNCRIRYRLSAYRYCEIERSLYHYTCLLGFSQAWNYLEGERRIVIQANRGSGCELILSEDRPYVGKSPIFVSLDKVELITFQAELEAKGIPVERSWWGYPVIVIKDPDGNELLIPLE